MTAPSRTPSEANGSANILVATSRLRTRVVEIICGDKIPMTLTQMRELDNAVSSALDSWGDARIEEAAKLADTFPEDYSKNMPTFARGYSHGRNRAATEIRCLKSSGGKKDA